MMAQATAAAAKRSGRVRVHEDAASELAPPKRKRAKQSTGLRRRSGSSLSEQTASPPPDERQPGATTGATATAGLTRRSSHQRGGLPRRSSRSTRDGDDDRDHDAGPTSRPLATARRAGKKKRARAPGARATAAVAAEIAAAFSSAKPAQPPPAPPAPQGVAEASQPLKDITQHLQQPPAPKPAPKLAAVAPKQQQQQQQQQQSQVATATTTTTAATEASATPAAATPCNGLVGHDLLRLIFRNLRLREKAYAVHGPLMGRVTPRMWAILVDWLIEVQVNFKHSQNTLFLAVNILSRFFRKHAVERANLQLAGAAALLIASKHEEMNQREIADYVYICADTYQREEVLAMERLILRVVDYKLCVPLSSNFVMRYAPHLHPRELALAMFLLESTMQDFRFSWLPSSLVAAAAIFLTGRVLTRPLWSPEMAAETGYSAQVILQCSALIHQHVADELEFEQQLTTCRQKYADDRHHKVASTDALDYFRVNASELPQTFEDLSASATAAPSSEER